MVPLNTNTIQRQSKRGGAPVAPTVPVRNGRSGFRLAIGRNTAGQRTATAFHSTAKGIPSNVQDEVAKFFGDIEEPSDFTLRTKALIKQVLTSRPTEEEATALIEEAKAALLAEKKLLQEQKRYAVGPSETRGGALRRLRNLCDAQQAYVNKHALQPERLQNYIDRRKELVKELKVHVAHRFLGDASDRAVTS